METTEIAKLFRLIKRYYPNFDGSVEAVKDSYRFLKDIPYEDAERNVEQHIKTKAFWPTIAEIRGTVQGPAETRLPIPGVEETKQMLASLRSIEATGPTPEQRERVMRSVGRSV